MQRSRNLVWLALIAMLLKTAVNIGYLSVLHFKGFVLTMLRSLVRLLERPCSLVCGPIPMATLSGKPRLMLCRGLPQSVSCGLPSNASLLMAPACSQLFLTFGLLELLL